MRHSVLRAAPQTRCVSAFERPLRLFLCRSEDQSGRSHAQRRRARDRSHAVVDADATIGGLMSRLPLSSRRARCRLAGAMMFGALAACAEPTLPAAPASPSAIIIIGGHPVVLTAQLRAIGN